MKLFSKYLGIAFGVLASASYAQRGKDGNITINTANKIVNEYTTLTANAVTGATTISVAASSLNSNGRFTASLAAGDLVMIIQMQGATILGQPDAGVPTISNPNDATWGGVTSYNNCGKYEYAQVSSVPNATSIVLDCGLTNSYTASGKVQVIRVQRYNTLTITAPGVLTCQAWNGTTGGVLAVEVLGNTTMNAGSKISASGTGFRGGALFTTTGRTTTTIYSCVSLDVGSNKGEGIAGYDTDYTPYGGKYCRGAAANAGGGGNVWNCGGGGGANAGNTGAWTGQGNPNNSVAGWTTAWNQESASFATSTSSGGGRGGYAFSSSNQNALTLGPGTPGSTNAWGGAYRYNLGGLGGRPLDYSSGRIFLGGGGGAGEQDNGQAGAGGKGGGIIYFVSYGNITGTGNDSILSDGANGGSTVISGSNSGKDAGGGAGGGGTIILNATGTVSGVAVKANGGTGGHQLQNTSGFFPLTEAEGPGGGGGGGYIAISNGTPVQVANGGINGISQSPHVTEFTPNGATMGGTGLTGQTITNFNITASNVTICSGNTATLTAAITGTAPVGTTLMWYSAQTGGTSLGSGTTFTTPVLNSGATYYVGTCPGTFRIPVVVTVNPGLTVSVNSPTICAGSTTTLTATGATSYTWSAGATSTGVNTATVSPASTATFTVTGTSGSCSGTAVSTVTVAAAPVATFSYTGTPYCKNAPNPSPTFSGGGSAGVFSSTGGLSINSGTGVVDLAASTPGTYTVTNTIAASGGCPQVTANSTITITSLPVATFSYTASPYCQSAANPSPTFSGGGTAGVFSSTVGLSINPASGAVNLAGSTPGTYTVTNTIAASGGCPQVTATANITITAPQVATFNYPATPYCKNAANPSPAFTGGGVAGVFSSTGGLSVNPSTGVVDLAASTAGTYTVTNTIAASGGCPQVQATASITISAVPVATFSYTASPYCQNGSDPSPAFSGGGTAGTFASSGGLSINASTGVVDLSLSTPGTYNVSNTIAASGGCAATSATGSITINAPKAADFNYASSPYCQNASDPSPVFTNGGVAGVFSSSTGLSIDPANGMIDLSASNSGTYNVTNTIAATGGCPVVTATSLITIDPVQSAAFSYSTSTFCQSGTNPTPSVSGTTGGTFSATPAGLAIDPATGVITLASSALNNYNVTYTTSGPCADDSTISITVTTAPVATFAYAAVFYCTDASDPSPVFSGGGTGGVFSSTAGLNISPGTGVIDLSTSTPGTYTVTNSIVASGGCSAATSTTTVTINAVPPAAFSYSAASYCQSASDPSPVLQLGSVSGTYSSLSGLNINSSNGVVDVSLSTPGSYTVYNAITGACPSLDSTVIAITASPDVTITQPASICVGAPSFNLTAATSGGTWSGTGITDAVNGTFFPGSGVGSDTITYILSGACPATDTVVITVLSSLDATITAVAPVCVGSAPFNLSAATSGGAWSGIGITNTVAGTFNPSSPGTFSVTYTISGSCGNTDTEVITVNSPVSISLNPISPVCAGSNAFNLTATPASGTWSGTGITDANAGTFNPSTAGTFNVTYTIAGACGNTASQNITVNALPVPALTSDLLSGCAPLCVNFTELTASACAGVGYDFGDGTTGTTSSPAHCYSSSGSYPVSISCTDNNGCTGTTSSAIVITVQQTPTASMTVSPTGILPTNTTVTFTDASVSGGNQIWNFGDTASVNNASFLSSDSHTYASEGTYCITLISSNNFGCIDSTFECIMVVDDAEVSVPNIFTPNGDGKNDVFRISSTGLKSLKCVIYDRWGLKIAELSSVNEGWDGTTTTGNLAADGVYFYILDFTALNDKTTKKQGFVQLLNR
jgi:gliding motility-associated-like protein